jgi:hypothetical protein
MVIDRVWLAARPGNLVGTADQQLSELAAAVGLVSIPDRPQISDQVSGPVAGPVD